MHGIGDEVGRCPDGEHRMLHFVDAHDLAVHPVAERIPCLVGAAGAAGTQRDDRADLAVAAGGEQPGVTRRVHGVRDRVEQRHIAALTSQRVSSPFGR